MNTQLKGLFFVAIGAASYGVLATMIKLANIEDVHTSLLTFGQFLFGLIGLTLLRLFNNNKQKAPATEMTKKTQIQLLLYGISFGMTSIFYYISIQYIPVSMGIILLMQTIWLGVALEFFFNRKAVTKIKLIGAFIVIVGTLFAVNIFSSDVKLHWLGLTFGFLAAISYTISLHASHSVGINLPPLLRSQQFILGGFITVILFWNMQIITHFDFISFLKWGIPLAVFGTILPPILFNKGIPIIGTGLGGVVSSIEIPVSIISAYIFLYERVEIIQWIGVCIIISAIIFINIPRRKKV